MACEIVSTQGAVFALWGKPERLDFDRVIDALQSAANAVGHPVLYLTRVPIDAPAPDAEARARLSELMPGITAVCSSYHVVLEGDGFAAAMKRGILTGLFQLNWRRKTFFVHASVEDVAKHVTGNDQRALTAILRAAAANQLL